MMRGMDIFMLLSAGGAVAKINAEKRWRWWIKLTGLGDNLEGVAISGICCMWRIAVLLIEHPAH